MLPELIRGARGRVWLWGHATLRGRNVVNTIKS